VTIPQAAVADLPGDLLAGARDDVAVVDTGNYYPHQRDGRIDAIEDGTVESRWVEQQLGRPVVKAFNNIFAQHLLENGRPAGEAGRIALPVASDDDAGKAVVMRLVDELGFDAVDAGGLDESWRQQPGTPVYTTDHDADGVRRALAEASPERAPEWRGTADSPASVPADILAPSFVLVAVRAHGRYNPRREKDARSRRPARLPPRLGRADWSAKQAQRRLNGGSSTGLAAFMAQGAADLRGFLDEIHARVIDSPVVHFDEAGARTEGRLR